MKHRVRLNESQLRRIVKESVKNVLKEGTSNEKLIDAWYEAVERMGGAENMCDALFRAMSHDEILDYLKFFNRTHELGLDLNDIY